MEHLGLRHGGGETEILVGRGALAAAAPWVEAWLAGRTVFAVAPAPLRRLHGTRLEELCAAARRVDLEVPDGEAAKTLAVCGRLWEEMLRAGGKRDSRLIALGGGSVSDVAGFVAGCFLRGLEVVLIPTTVLAQLDAAIGGKTGIDLPGAKNSVGAFHHPRLVVADSELLSSLPRAERVAGLVEAIKVAALLDARLLERIEGTLERLVAGDPAELGAVIGAAARAKIVLVERDPRETGDRRLLNFGHTLGHAIEAVAGFGSLRHGEAVAYGILFALRLALRRGLEPELEARLRGLLARLPLPALPALSVEGLLEAVQRDKKARESGPVWVLPSRAGEGRAVEDVPLPEVRRELVSFLADPWRARPGSRL